MIPPENELLVPLSFVNKDGFIYHLVNDIDENDFNISKGGQIEMIGWLYQYYNTEPKDRIISRNSKVKIKKEEIPIATQLFTPNWIVRYMVENSLGRLWKDHFPDRAVKFNWKYYLDDVTPESVSVENSLSPEKVRFIDPCMGADIF